MSSSLASTPQSMHQSTNKGVIRTLIEELQEIFDKSIEDCFPQLDEEISQFSRLKRDGQGKYGDYICFYSTNVWNICRRLRSSDTYLFRHTRSRDIAQQILEAVKKNELIKKLCVRDVGYLTVELSFQWMFKRIQKMLDDHNGMDSWAPVLAQKSAVVGFLRSAKGADLHADVVRCRFIEGMLFRMLDYSGIVVGRGYVNKQSQKVVDACFTEEGRVFASRINKTSLFVGDTKKSLKIGRYDLGALWCAIHEERGDVIVYVTPVRQREYVEKCFNVATDVGWLSCPPNHLLRCCGCRTSSSERDKLVSFWNNYSSHSEAASLVRLGRDAGYTSEELFECALKYTYLKTHRLAECTFNLDEMLHEEGNTFVYLLKTRVLISSLSKNSGGRGMLKYTKAFFTKEREVALHLVQFTEVIQRACSTLLLHPVCEYLWTLCEKFMTYYSQVMQFLRLRTFKSKLYLCDATKVVMEKSFYLLGITQEFSQNSSRHAFSNTPMTYFGVIPLPRCVPHCVVARPETTNPRIELFCMNVHVAYSAFKKGRLFGNVSLKDTDGLLCDQRVPLDRNEHGYVSYFYRDWDQTIGIGNNAFIFFGNPTPCYLAPFSSSIEMYVHLFATTLEKDKFWEICNCKASMDLKEISVHKPYKRGIANIVSEDGIIDINYMALRDAVDTSMTLTLEAANDLNPELCVSGHIFAYYGNGMLDELDDFEQGCYKAIVFKAEAGYKLKVGSHAMKKSVLAVPVNGELVIEARFYNKSSSWTQERNFSAKIQGESVFYMPFDDNCRFNLTVKWNQGRKTCYS